MSPLYLGLPSSAGPWIWSLVFNNQKGFVIKTIIDPASTPESKWSCVSSFEVAPLLFSAR